MSLTTSEPLRFGRFPRSLALAPGLGLLFAIGYAGKVAEHALTDWGRTHHVAVPTIEYVLWAILIGLVVSNTVGVPRIFRAGVATYEFWLKIGIILLGVRFLLGDVLRLGAISLIVVAVELILSIALMTWLGRRFGLSEKLTSLLAIGSSICGVSAIIAARGAIDAKDEDVSYAIAAILALGAIGLFTFPVIGQAIGLTDQAYGLWAGLAIDNTAEAAAAGALWSDEAGRIAVLAKTTRNATIGFVVLGFALYWATRGQAQAVGNKAAFLWAKFPKFILGFLLVSLLATFGAFTPTQSADIAALSRWAFLLTFAGVGLQTDLRAMRRQGFRPFIVGALGELGIALITLGIVVTVQPWLPG
ncbi:putative sulfate exporter family transporter [Rhodovastum atsumiense]|uniref:Putative sulfate exporter family transporter n=1 Tax=Rhodovastum atsumiense TaxID=504468 RepID=A0A5M6IQG9_9PROT|nr:putative sulfate exporter family transporter [Rhodovastum atsumiense]KAA5610512.1 putative sulfate exporter family transporter [Rhodovastum atsumiense]CAH2605052.1 putative sulfate exporter family transporter [Rhodovastum atsumiense]